MNYSERRLALELQQAEGELSAWQHTLDVAEARLDLEGAHVREAEAALAAAREQLWARQERVPRICGVQALIVNEGELGGVEAEAQAARGAYAQAEQAHARAARQLALARHHAHELRQQLGLPEQVSLRVAPEAPAGGDDDPPSVAADPVPAASMRERLATMARDWRLS
jgi:multidrug resistance efflux pump